MLKVFYTVHLQGITTLTSQVVLTLNRYLFIHVQCSMSQMRMCLVTHVHLCGSMAGAYMYSEGVPLGFPLILTPSKKVCELAS